MIEDTSEDSFAERVAEPLRELERADPTFEARAMSAVHAAARSTIQRSWWTRRRTVSISPLASLALAAGFAGLAIAGSSLADALLSRAQTHGTGSPAVAVHDTVHVVRFVLVDSSARRVALVGEFNQWDKNATFLRATSANGGGGSVWTIEVPLSAGRHEYAFVVYDARGERWVADPFGQLVRDEFGTLSTVISVGAPATS